MLRRLVMWLVLVGLTPAGPELVESVLHFVREGDFVHTPDPRHTPQLPQQEHGCSALCHACRCHGPSSPSRSAPSPGQPTSVARLAPHADLQRFAAQATPEPQVPPPIA